MRELNAFEYFILGLKKCTQFSGRATRSEFWYFILLQSVISLLFAWIGTLLFKDTPASNLFSDIWELTTLLPTFALYCRRLHDTNRSGWWSLLTLTIVGFIPLIVFWCQKSNPHANRFDAPYYPSFD